MYFFNIFLFWLRSLSGGFFMSDKVSFCNLIMYSNYEI